MQRLRSPVKQTSALGALRGNGLGMPDQPSVVVPLGQFVSGMVVGLVRGWQLSLVIMGGSRIPEYRRTLMPFLAAFVLCFGSATLFVDTPWVFQ